MYSVQYTGNTLSTEQIFGKIIKEVENLEDNTQGTIIYCQTRTQCSLSWRTFSIKLGTKFYFSGIFSPKFRSIEMFHAGTPSHVEEYIIEETGNNNCHLRILICTTAFGMGVNCKGFNLVIQFGPSQNLESYMQECGRAGRNGNSKMCYLIYNGLLTSTYSDDMKDFIHTEGCRRECVAKHFTSSTDDSLKRTCLCCDNCATKCTSCSCTENCQAVFDLTHQSISESATPVKTRKVSQVH